MRRLLFASIAFGLLLLPTLGVSAAAAEPPSCPPVHRRPGGIWQAPPTTAPLQRQLRGRIDTGVPACFFDVGRFDIARVGQCFQHRECGSDSPFVQRDKPVLEAEHEREPSDYCGEAKSLDFSAIRKSYDLFAQRWAPC